MHLLDEWIRDGWLVVSDDGKKLLFPDSTREAKPAAEVRVVEEELMRRIFYPKLN
jgi:hypothetical protein